MLGVTLPGRPRMRPTQPVVLIVEDDPAINTLLVDLLEGGGYDVIATPTAAMLWSTSRPGGST